MGPFTYPDEQMNRVLASLAISVDNITPDALAPEDFDEIQKK